ncbi:MAG: hypothetical protein AAB631_03025 [Patescibacteria group bacterium]
MKRIYIVGTIVLTVATLLIFGSRGKQSTKQQVPGSQLSTELLPALEMQTNSEGSVTVKITPNLSSEVAFEVALDTHSEDLSADLTQTVMLKDENGKEYKPVRWEGDPPGGHHRNGLLMFGSIAPLPKTLQLVVGKVGGVEGRTFLWIIRS